MPRRNSTTEIKNGKVVFSKEVLNYFESIRTEENSVWIDKYFEYLSDEENLSAEKYNGHHIIPCFTFKDYEHKNRKQTKPLADKVKGNIIKLSIYNHILTHYCLWKIFGNHDSKMAFQQMCGLKTNIDNLIEDELKEIAKLKEECAKENQTEEELKEYQIKYRKEHKENKLKTDKIYRENNKEKISKNKKIYYKENLEYFAEKRKQYNQEHKERIKEINKLYYENNYDKIKSWSKEYNAQMCYDPIKKNYCTLGTLFSRKKRHKNEYSNVSPSKCIIEENQFDLSLSPNISS